MEKLVSFKFNEDTLYTGKLIRKGFICGNYMYTVDVDGKIYNVYQIEK